MNNIKHEFCRIKGPLFPDTDSTEEEHLVVRVIETPDEMFIEIARETYDNITEDNQLQDPEYVDPDYGLLFLETEIDKAEIIVEALTKAIALIKQKKEVV